MSYCCHSFSATGTFWVLSLSSYLLEWWFKTHFPLDNRSSGRSRSYVSIMTAEKNCNDALFWISLLFHVPLGSRGSDSQENKTRVQTPDATLAQRIVALLQGGLTAEGGLAQNHGDCSEKENVVLVYTKLAIQCVYNHVIIIIIVIMQRQTSKLWFTTWAHLFSHFDEFVPFPAPQDTGASCS